MDACKPCSNYHGVSRTTCRPRSVLIIQGLLTAANVLRITLVSLLFKDYSSVLKDSLIAIATVAVLTLGTVLNESVSDTLN